MALACVARDLPGFSKKIGLSADLPMLDTAWEREMGALRGLARIAALDRTTLVIEADSAAAMQEISLRRRELVRKLNRHFPSPLIEALVVRTNPHGR